jgi:hypothetical protein
LHPEQFQPEPTLFSYQHLLPLLLLEAQARMLLPVGHLVQGLQDVAALDGEAKSHNRRMIVQATNR